ncbi:PLDc N-terminal domain-containing protein [Microbacterium stercoris]|uniref:PLDc N-terminal domain-containing protein n=1 Tax=Microbacterium stercoris TaxID=2820289 RepID=A0A939TQD5_9MICO|nr:PLDc N-terminal domain-containing protein [Microbacterium stercoris]MBO3663016.1 PLDc N-terminal domain-containing protein [Microbacterium stercoris]
MTTKNSVKDYAKVTAATAATAKTAEAGVGLVGKAFLSLLGLVQIGLALAAFSDLWARPEKQVRMTKLAWIPIILINWIGPLAYFIGGVKR